MLAKTPSSLVRWSVMLGLVGLLILPQAPASDDSEVGIVKLRWDLSWEPDIAGYRVHYGPESGIYTEIVDVGYKVKAELKNLPVGATYYCAVTAYNTYGLESDYSNEIAFTVKPPPEERDTDGDFLSDLFESTWGKGGDMDATADLDGDGLSALAEFAHGLNPLRAHNRPAGTIEPLVVDGTNYLSIRYLVDPLAERFVTIHVERSLDITDPDSWQRGQTVVVSAQVFPDDPDLIELVARSLTPMSAQATEYLRFSYETVAP